MNKIDYEGILKEATKYSSSIGNTYMEIEAMKEALRQAIPIILEHVAEKAKVQCHFGGEWPNHFCDGVVVDKESITSQKEELSKLFGI